MGCAVPGDQLLRLRHHTISQPNHVRFALPLLVLIENEERTRAPNSLPHPPSRDLPLGPLHLAQAEPHGPGNLNHQTLREERGKRAVCISIPYSLLPTALLYVKPFPAHFLRKPLNPLAKYFCEALG